MEAYILFNNDKTMHLNDVEFKTNEFDYIFKYIHSEELFIAPRHSVQSISLYDSTPAHKESAELALS